MMKNFRLGNRLGLLPTLSDLNVGSGKGGTNSNLNITLEIPSTIINAHRFGVFLMFDSATLPAVVQGW